MSDFIDIQLEKLKEDIKQKIIDLLKDSGKIPYYENRPFLPLTITVDIGDFE